jgi:hypothetical protein
VDDRRVDPATGQRVQFHSVVLPRCAGAAGKVAEVLPLRYLHGLSSLDFVPALEAFFGASAGLSASVVTRLATQRQAERQAFLERNLQERDDVSCWADGIHFNIRLEEGRLCCLVLGGARRPRRLCVVRRPAVVAGRGGRAVRTRNVQATPWLSLVISEGEGDQHAAIVLEGPARVVAAAEAPPALLVAATAKLPTVQEWATAHARAQLRQPTQSGSKVHVGHPRWPVAFPGGHPARGQLLDVGQVLRGKPHI